VTSTAGAAITSWCSVCVGAGKAQSEGRQLNREPVEGGGRGGHDWTVNTAPTESSNTSSPCPNCVLRRSITGKNVVDT
jgi:hypothetical protein